MSHVVFSCRMPLQDEDDAIACDLNIPEHNAADKYPSYAVVKQCLLLFFFMNAGPSSFTRKQKDCHSKKEK